MTEVRVLEGLDSQLGEGALWDGRRQQLISIDMVTGSLILNRLGAERVEAESLVVGDYIGAAFLTDSDAIGIVTMHGLALVGSDGVLPLVEIVSDRSLRLNDAACDSRGRVWVGSTDLETKPGRGALHVWPGAGDPITVASGLTLPNGIGWSPGDDVLYLADSGQGVLLRASFDAATGRIGELTPLFRVDQGEPDGLCVDDDGTIWLAIWDGSRVEHIAPDGRLIETISVPAARPTSCANVPHVGLVITTARFGLSNDDLAMQTGAGKLLLAEAGGAGVPAGRVQIS